jgi:hypothetical protein
VGTVDLRVLQVSSGQDRRARLARAWQGDDGLHSQQDLIMVDAPLLGNQVSAQNFSTSCAGVKIQTMTRVSTQRTGDAISTNAH